MKRLAIVGLGLMGGSLGLAARRRGLAESVWGFSRRDVSRRGALAIGAADRVFDRPEQAVEGADMAVFCAPILAIPGLVRRCRGSFASRCVVTDVGSTKSELVAALGPLFRGIQARFVGSHPIAGSEKTGIRAARADLYEGAVVAVTPSGRRGEAADREGRRAVAAVRRLWEGVGARVVFLDPAEHDRILARTSHLPHLLAAALVAAVGRDRRAAALCGPGFRDATRLAAGSDEVWHDIVKTNREAVAREMKSFGAILERVRRMLEAGDFEGLRRFLAASARLRRGLDRVWGGGPGRGRGRGR